MPDPSKSGSRAELDGSITGELAAANGQVTAAWKNGGWRRLAKLLGLTTKERAHAQSEQLGCVAPKVLFRC